MDDGRGATRTGQVGRERGAAAGPKRRGGGPGAGASGEAAWQAGPGVASGPGARPWPRRERERKESGEWKLGWARKKRKRDWAQGKILIFI